MALFAVAHPLPEPALRILHEAGEVRAGAKTGPLPAAELAELARGADALITLLYDRIDGEFLDQLDALGSLPAGDPAARGSPAPAGAGSDRSGAGRLRVVANVAVGYDNLATSELNERGIVATNTPDVLTDATADLAFGLILAVTRRLGEGERLIRAGRRWSWGLDFMLGRSLQGKTLGVAGLGRIGTATARRARASGMDVVYHSRNRASPELERELGGARWVGHEELLTTADVVSLHLPLTEDTRHLIDASALALMKPTAYLVNTARGPIVDELALAAALDSDEIAGAALDVYEHEPAVDPGLLAHENLVAVPHLGSATEETREAMAVLAARNAVEVVAGRNALTPIR